MPAMELIDIMLIAEETHIAAQKGFCKLLFMFTGAQ
jgi:hypothetical protein